MSAPTRTPPRIPTKRISIGIGIALAGTALITFPPHFEYAMYGAIIISAFLLASAISELAVKVWIFVAALVVSAVLVAAFGATTQELALQALGTTDTCTVTSVDYQQQRGKTGTRWNVSHVVKCPDAGRFTIETNRKNAHDPGPASVRYHRWLTAEFTELHNPAQRAGLLGAAALAEALVIALGWWLGRRQRAASPAPITEPATPQPDQQQ